MCLRNSSLPPPVSHIEDEWLFVCNGSFTKGRILDLKGSILWVTFCMCLSLWSTSWPCLLTQNSLFSQIACVYEFLTSLSVGTYFVLFVVCFVYYTAKHLRARIVFDKSIKPEYTDKHSVKHSLNLFLGQEQK